MRRTLKRFISRGRVNLHPKHELSFSCWSWFLSFTSAKQGLGAKADGIGWASELPLVSSVWKTINYHRIIGRLFYVVKLHCPSSFECTWKVNLSVWGVASFFSSRVSQVKLLTYQQWAFNCGVHDKIESWGQAVEELYGSVTESIKIVLVVISSRFVEWGLDCTFRRNSYVACRSR